MVGKIRYNPKLNKTAGYVVITEGKPPLDQDGKTLLALLHWALYTQPGREFMRNNLPDVDGDLSGVKREALQRKCAEYGVTAPDLQDAIINAHVAAQLYANAFNKEPQRDEKAMTLHENVYLQNMAFVTWSLWEDAKDHEFSMGW